MPLHRKDRSEYLDRPTRGRSTHGPHTHSTHSLGLHQVVLLPRITHYDDQISSWDSSKTWLSSTSTQSSNDRRNSNYQLPGYFWLYSSGISPWRLSLLASMSYDTWSHFHTMAEGDFLKVQSVHRYGVRSSCHHFPVRIPSFPHGISRWSMRLLTSTSNDTPNEDRIPGSMRIFRSSVFSPTITRGFVPWSFCGNSMMFSLNIILIDEFIHQFKSNRESVWMTDLWRIASQATFLSAHYHRHGTSFNPWWAVINHLLHDKNDTNVFNNH